MSLWGVAGETGWWLVLWELPEKLALLTRGKEHAEQSNSKNNQDVPVLVILTQSKFFVIASSLAISSHSLTLLIIWSCFSK